jgi:hypothetical protein
MEKEINSHFNYCHIGCEILSRSKHEMNIIICLAEDLGITIYYQDTDSIHLRNDDIKLLRQAYMICMKRNL